MCFPSVCTAPNPSMKRCIYRELYQKVLPLLPLFGALPLAKVLPPLLFLFVCFFLFLVALGLSCCPGTLSSWSAGTSHCGGFSCCRAQALGSSGCSRCGTRVQFVALGL